MLPRILLAVVTAFFLTASLVPMAQADTYWETVREFQTGYDRDGN